jgi:FkbM family methyltransferase
VGQAFQPTFGFPNRLSRLSERAMHSVSELELPIMRAISTRLPGIRGAGAIGTLFAAIYSRKRRERVKVNTLGFKMVLDPHEYVDRGLLFQPQLVDRAERRFLEKRLKPGDTMLDIGAYIGFYTLVASRLVERDGLVVSIEANPESYERLSDHLRMNNARNVKAYNLGVSDEEGHFRLGINTTGSRGSSSFLLQELPAGVDVACTTLREIVVRSGLKSITGLKIDIEGLEYRVLKRFFDEIDRDLFPKFIITEFLEQFRERAGGHTIDLLLKQGYRILSATKYGNFIMELV